MGLNEELRKAIRQLAGTDNIDGVSSFDCTVDSVDEDEFTCDVTAIGSNATTSVPGVRIASESNDGFKMIPKVGSTVTVIVTDRGLAYISMFSDIEKVVFMDGTYGGMAKIIELTAKLNTMENDLNAIKAAFTAWVVVPNDGGAALKAAAATWSGQTLTPTVRADIENVLIKHGI